MRQNEYPSASAFRKQLERFHRYLEQHPKSTGPFTNFRSGLIHEEEGYKEDLSEEGRRRLGAADWSASSAGSGEILAATVSAIEIDIQDGDRTLRNNLVQWQARFGTRASSHFRLVSLREDEDRLREVESILCGLYQGTTPEEDAFDALVSHLGRKYDLLAYLFFLRDGSRFVPISTRAFERAFELLEIPFGLTNRCSWRNYAEFLRRLHEVRELLSDHLRLDVRLLDAHTFCYILGRCSPRGDGAGLDALGSESWKLYQKIRVLPYEHDRRRYPDMNRAGRFKAGWKDAADRNLIYEVSTLNQLTWTNLGYRLGQLYGSSADELIESVFGTAANLYRAEKLHHVMEDLVHKIHRETGFIPAQFRLELHENGGLRVARRILASRTPTRADSKRIAELGRPDLTVEYLCLDERFRDLFNQHELTHATWHLEQFPSAFDGDHARGADHEIEGHLEVDDAESIAHDQSTSSSQEQLDDDRRPPQVYFEGQAGQVTSNRYERDPGARAACIQHFEAYCSVCDLDFAERYGSIGAGFIHVHHRFPLSSRNGPCEVDPIKDLVPVCPNCHAMLHTKNPPLEVDKLRSLLRD